ncbi:Hypothetical predicted protein [Mytilus galloprovincialis]|uniref:Uncharacterized protein n=1 Tax=Mytilus galloprovincialis TaxID=29158 RepID=A0A8B6GJP8_MYTGA|nr:Hypothetical predicted protein [Mytilus galloprovincialis]
MTENRQIEAYKCYTRLLILKLVYIKTSKEPTVFNVDKVRSLARNQRYRKILLTNKETLPTEQVFFGIFRIFSISFKSNRHDKGQNHKDLNHRKLPSGVDLRFEVGGTLLNKRLEDIKYNSDRPGEIHRIRKKLFLA